MLKFVPNLYIVLNKDWNIMLVKLFCCKLRSRELFSCLCTPQWPLLLAYAYINGCNCRDIIKHVWEHILKMGKNVPKLLNCLGNSYARGLEYRIFLPAFYVFQNLFFFAQNTRSLAFQPQKDVLVINNLLLIEKTQYLGIVI